MTIFLQILIAILYLGAGASLWSNVIMGTRPVSKKKDFWVMLIAVPTFPVWIPFAIILALVAWYKTLK